MFELHSNFPPRGDQQKAIERLVEGLKENNQFQTLLGITGSGKTFTLANVVKQYGKPTLILAHNKTLAAQLFNELKSLFPNSLVEYYAQKTNRLFGGKGETAR
jgi:excinuclease ABC subunit B